MVIGGVRKGNNSSKGYGGVFIEDYNNEETLHFAMFKEKKNEDVK